MDETGWRLKGERRALWGLFTVNLAVYRIAADRHEDRARQLLGASSAIVTSDRWWAYNYLPLARRQICWSHVQRDFQAMAEARGAERELGDIGLRVCDELFFAWQIYQHTGQRKELQRRIRGLQRELKPILRPARARNRATSAAAGWRATCSRSGPRSGRSLAVAACNPPTTTPSARCAARSSTASSRSAANPSTANTASNDSYRPPPPAAYKTDRCSNTSQTCSTPTAAAKRSPRSPESADA